MKVIKRDGTIVPFDINKIRTAINKAAVALNTKFININYCLEDIENEISYKYERIDRESVNIPIEVIQDIVEEKLSAYDFNLAKAFILYREQHKELRLVKDRAKYIEEYSASKGNAASNSEVDANANVQNKNIATLNSELYKKFNVNLSRYRISQKLKELYGSDCDYTKLLESHLIYKHDEGSSAAIMPYCVAVTLYPFLLHGTSTLDGLKAGPPNHLESFAGQFNNLVFLLSSQFAGAIAFGEFFNVFNYYCVKDFGKDYYKYPGDNYTINTTIEDKIKQTFQNIVYTLNQPAGNRSFQSPFTNISYFDSNYWKALFEDFYYPDGTKPEWEAVDYLQRLFIHWFNEERTKVILTFPVNRNCGIIK